MYRTIDKYFEDDTVLITHIDAKTQETIPRSLQEIRHQHTKFKVGVMGFADLKKNSIINYLLEEDTGNMDGDGLASLMDIFINSLEETYDTWIIVMDNGP